jgi:hypothetical protein
MIDTARRCAATLAWAAPLLVLAALAAWPAGCGYHQDVPALPGGAHTLALQRVANLTDTGELDVRLRALLQQRLAQQAHVRVLPPERSALGLSLALDAFAIDRALDPAITSDRSFQYSLNGRMTLIELSSGRKLIDNEAVSASVQRLYAPAVQETPAIRDEGINDVLAAFAEAVERRLFRTF